MTGPSWEPANQTEAAMLAAAQQRDQPAFLAAVRSSQLLLPVTEAAADGREAPRWTTGELEGTTFLPAFTSPEAIAAALPGVDVRYRVTSFQDLAAAWPHPDWRLALNPRLPIAAQLDYDVITALASQRQPPPTRPAQLTPGEEELWQAIVDGDSTNYLATLVRQTLLLPLAPEGGLSRDLTDPQFPWWRVTDDAGVTTIPVFTSEYLLREALAVDHDYIEVGPLQLVDSWPDPRYSLAIDPDTGLATLLTGEQVQTLDTFFREVRTALNDGLEEHRRRAAEAELHRLARFDPDELDIEELDAGALEADALDADAVDADAPGEVLAADAPLTLQLVIPHAYLSSYLDGGYNRAAGLVHAWRGPGRETPKSLYRRLGLLGEGSPFTVSDEWVAVLRWAPDEQTPEHWGRGEPCMEAVAIPDGAEIYRIGTDRAEERLARYDATAGRWLAGSGDPAS